jgi:CheY-like chemotaxis protein
MSRRVIAVVPDLFFAAKIAETAKAAGVALEQPAPSATLARCREALPALVILDLGTTATLEVARALRGDPVTRAVPIVGFYSHVDVAMRDAARAAGVDDVLPRSAFVAKLAALLRGSPPEGANG